MQRLVGGRERGEGERQRGGRERGGEQRYGDQLLVMLECLVECRG